MQAPRILVTCAILTFLSSVVETSRGSLDEEIRAARSSNMTPREIPSLSRKRRYLLFPLGSSLQLVYDTTFPIVVGSAPFVFGSTAALAWQLPYEIIGPLLKLKEKGLRRVDKPDKKQETFRPTQHKTVHYYKPVRYYQNSGAHRRVENRKHADHQRISHYGKRKNYYYTMNRYRRPVTTYANPYFNEVHRRTRRQLFVKVEKFLSAQRKDGRACLLKAVCEVSQASEVGKGTFVEEIIKAIFRFHPHHTGKEHDVYDLAAVKSHNCTEMYPTCDHSLWNFF